MKTTDKIVLAIFILVIAYTIFTSESVGVSEDDLNFYENIDYCVGVYWGNENNLNIHCDMDVVELYINN